MEGKKGGRGQKEEGWSRKREDTICRRLFIGNLGHSEEKLADAV